MPRESITGVGPEVCCFGINIRCGTSGRVRWSPFLPVAEDAEGEVVRDFPTGATV